MCRTALISIVRYSVNFRPWISFLSR